MSEGVGAVAFVGAIDSDGRHGGTPAYSPAGTLFQERLLAGLAAAGVEVSQVFAVRPLPSYPADRRLLLPSGRTMLLERFGVALLPFVNLGPLKPVTAGASLLPRLMHWLRARRDVRASVITYNVTNPPGLATVLAARLSGAKAFAVVADVQVPGAGLVPDTFFRRLEFRLQARTLPLFDGLIVLTERIARDFAPRVPYLVLEGAVPEGLIETAPREPNSRVPGGDDLFTLMYAGGLSELKGIPLLLDAFSRLPGPEYRLWITGAGPLQATVERAAANDARITFWGFPPYGEVLAMYQRASLLVNPHSSTEASARYLFPSKLIEYLASGTPVLSTRSTPEIEREYGSVLYTIARDSGEELADAVRRVAALPVGERRALGAQAREFVLREKTWEVQGRRVARFVRDVWDGQGPTGAPVDSDVERATGAAPRGATPVAVLGGGPS
jgi:glycosyltransferase involved in cell wall biosynthesis